MAQRPGVMFYFDLRPCLKRLSPEERGNLFEAILDYAELGVVPELDGMCGIAWDFIKPRIDRDGEAYERSVTQKMYATYCREQKRVGATPLPFDQWNASPDITHNQLIPSDPFPSASTSIDTPSTTVTDTSSNRETKATGGGVGEPLSDEEFNRIRQEKIKQLLNIAKS